MKEERKRAELEVHFYRTQLRKMIGVNAGRLADHATSAQIALAEKYLARAQAKLTSHEGQEKGRGEDRP